MYPMPQRMLSARNSVVVVPLLLEYVHRPPRVARDELRIGPCRRQLPPRQRLMGGTEGGDGVGAAQMLAPIEHAQIPIGLRRRCGKVEEGSKHGQIPTQLCRGACTQPQ